MVIRDCFTKGGKAYKELFEKGIYSFSSGVEEVGDYIAIIFKASTSKVEEFKKIVDKYINNLSIDGEALERKKRSFLKSFITSFEDIVNVEDNITCDLFDFHKLTKDPDKLFYSISLNETKEYIDSLNLDNKSYLTVK